MPSIEIPTGNPESPMLSLITVFEGDYESIIDFEQGKFLLLMKYELQDTNPKSYRKFAIFKIKVTTSSNNKKITKIEKIEEVTYTAPAALPEKDDSHPYKYFYTYAVTEPLPDSIKDNPCVKIYGNKNNALATKKSITTVNLSQNIPGTGENQKPLETFLLSDNAFEGNMAAYKVFSGWKPSTEDPQVCESTESNKKAPLMGLKLPEGEDSSLYRVMSVAVAES